MPVLISQILTLGLSKFFYRLEVPAVFYLIFFGGGTRQEGKCSLRYSRIIKIFTFSTTLGHKIAERHSPPFGFLAGNVLYRPIPLNGCRHAWYITLLGARHKYNPTTQGG